jgi:hypothetical protein
VWPTSHSSDARFGGKHHQLQIASTTNKTLILSKFQLHLGVIDKKQLQKPSNPKIRLQRLIQHLLAHQHPDV